MLAQKRVTSRIHERAHRNRPLSDATDPAIGCRAARRLKSEGQNQSRPKTNQPRKIKRQQNTNGRRRHATIHTEN
jgi:hypothetical protein